MFQIDIGDIVTQVLHQDEKFIAHQASLDNNEAKIDAQFNDLNSKLNGLELQIQRDNQDSQEFKKEALEKINDLRETFDKHKQNVTEDLEEIKKLVSNMESRELLLAKTVGNEIKNLRDDIKLMHERQNSNKNLLEKISFHHQKNTNVKVPIRGQNKSVSAPPPLPLPEELEQSLENIYEQIVDVTKDARSRQSFYESFR